MGRINLDAIFGLRFVLAVWIMRGHHKGYCNPGGLQDTVWYDVDCPGAQYFS